MDIKEQNRTPRKRPSTEKLDGNSESETKRRFANNRTNIRSAGSGAGTSMQATSLPRRRASKTDKESPAAPQRQVTVKKTFYNIPRDAARLRKPAFENSEEFPVLAEKRGRGLKKKRAVKILFLGGVGEIGKNMTAIEYGGDIVIIDAGLTFPNNEDMPGIDLVVPDITYLVQNKDKVKGILLTHGHEDHIGGIPYLLKELNPGTPVYGTKLTLMLADNKIQEHRIQNVTERVVQPGDRIKLGVFEVEFINVNHSISGAVALAIRTPCGLIYHSGDFKIDLTPVAGKPIDLERIAELGHEGVLLYMG
ncbi:MAG: MBL fold metallo-hydrolase, partial [Christensenellaceae bacterium]